MIKLFPKRKISDRIRQKNHEFISADPSDHITFPEFFFQDIRKQLQHKISLRMPQGIVDALKVVQITDHQHTGVHTVFLQDLLDGPLKSFPVHDPRQIVHHTFLLFISDIGSQSVSFGFFHRAVNEDAHHFRLDFKNMNFQIFPPERNNVSLIASLRQLPHQLLKALRVLFIILCFFPGQTHDRGKIVGKEILAGIVQKLKGTDMGTDGIKNFIHSLRFMHISVLKFADG